MARLQVFVLALARVLAVLLNGFALFWQALDLYQWGSIPLPSAAWVALAFAGLWFAVRPPNRPLRVSAGVVAATLVVFSFWVVATPFDALVLLALPMLSTIAVLLLSARRRPAG